MDINILRGLSTLMVMIAFIGVCLWAYSGKRKEEFTRAAQMPFADDDVPVKNKGEKDVMNNPDRSQHE